MLKDLVPEPSVSVSKRLRYRWWALPKSRNSLRRVPLLFGALKQIGWTRSADEGRPVDRDGAPLPWLTYGAIRWLEPRMTADLRVFEYGMGNSTLWFSGRVASVDGVEHTAKWAEHLQTILPDNARIEHRPVTGDNLHSGDGDRYAERLLELDGPFDVIVIDGMVRLDCVQPALDRIAAGGLIILDNSDRPRFNEVCAALDAAGLQRFDFAGLAPGNVSFSCTSVFAADLGVWSVGAPPPSEASSRLREFYGSESGLASRRDGA